MKAIALTFLLIPLILVSQTPEETIKEMKEGVIFVRLMTKENSIKAMEEMGKQDAANEIREKQREENLQIAEVFEDNFDFCPVMFFYSTCSKNIESGDFKGCLMDAGLQPIPEQKLAGITHFFIAEFGQIESNDEPYFTGYTLEESEDGGKEIRTNYGGDTEIGAAALVIRGANFKQLGDPFPYYVRTREGTPWKRSTKKTVSLLNSNLYDYYKKFQ